MNALNGQEVLLISMPWCDVRSPNLAVGILKAVLKQRGVSCTVLDAPLRLLKFISLDLYTWLSGVWGANEFVFTREFENYCSDEQLRVLQQICNDWEYCLGLSGHSAGSEKEKHQTLLRLRNFVIPRYLDSLLAEIDLERYALVGFSILFDQLFGSLALAHRIRCKRPDILMAFGGNWLAKPVGPQLQRVFTEMDVVAYGDGEPVIGPLFEAACGQRELSDVPNITYRDRGGDVHDSSGNESICMDSSPAPDYDDYFRSREKILAECAVSIPAGPLLVQASRGCWWGQRSACIFCGLNQHDLNYRQKSATTVAADLHHLSTRYGINVFMFADSILPVGGVDAVLPPPIQAQSPYLCLYQTKGQLKGSEIARCAKAGLRALQPGIESFSSDVLRRMKKGLTAAQAIFTVFTMMRHRIICFYNILYGFPGDQLQEYEQILRLLPRLYHLIPPGHTIEPFVVRHAALSEEAGAFGWKEALKADWRYKVILSDAFLQARGLKLEDFCHYYESPYRAHSTQMRDMFSQLRLAVSEWKSRFEGGAARLFYRDTSMGMVIGDSRTTDDVKWTTFYERHRAVREALMTSVMSREAAVKAVCLTGMGMGEAEEAILDLVAAGVVIDDDGGLVWVAFPEEYYLAAESMPSRAYLSHYLESIEPKHSSGWATLAEVAGTGVAGRIG